MAEEDRRLDVDEFLHTGNRDEEECAVDDPVNSKAQHLCGVESGLRAHDVRDLGDAWEDGV
jgi:hypothetical protein